MPTQEAATRCTETEFTPSWARQFHGDDLYRGGLLVHVVRILRGRLFSDSFASISPGSVPVFVVAELIGVATALVIDCLLQRDPARRR